MKRNLPLFTLCLLVLYSSLIGAQDSLRDEQPFCMSGWIQEINSKVHSNRCIEVSNCTEDSSFRVENTTCPKLIQTNEEGSGRYPIALKFQGNGKEYVSVDTVGGDKTLSLLTSATGTHASSNLTCPAVINQSAPKVLSGQSGAETAYHLFMIVLHAYKTLKKSHHINQKGWGKKDAKYLGYYMAGLIIHLLETPFFQVQDQLSYRQRIILHSGMIYVAYSATRWDCCCKSRYLNKHSLMLGLNALSLFKMGFAW